MTRLPLLSALLALAVALPAGVAPAAQDASFPFERDLAAARRAGLADGRPAIAWFTAADCAWCREMEAESFGDPTVVELARRFAWARVDRDARPDLVQRYDVRAYPSLLVLGRDEENVYRFAGKRSPAALVAELERALERWARYEAGEDWTAGAERPAELSPLGTVRHLPAPSQEVPGGATVLGEHLWVLQGTELCRLEPATGRKLSTSRLPGRITDLCSDGHVLYALEYGWTAGQPIHVVEPISGHVIQRLVTEENVGKTGWSALGIAFKDGKLHVVAQRGTIHVVDAESGRIEERYHPALGDLSGLAWDGEHFVAASATGLHFLEPQTFQRVRFAPTSWPLRSVAARGDELYLLEQPVFGYDRSHEWVQLWPREPRIHVWSLPAADEGEAK